LDTISSPHTQKVLASVELALWIEPFKFEWRRQNFQACARIASLANVQRTTADECALRVQIEVGEYVEALRWLTCVKERLPWMTAAAFICLIRGGEPSQYRASLLDESGLSPSMKLRVAYELAKVGDVEAACILACDVLESSSGANESSLALIAASLHSTVIGQSSPDLDLVSMIKGCQSAILVFNCCAAISTVAPTATALCLEALTSIDVAAVASSPAFHHANRQPKLLATSTHAWKDELDRIEAVGKRMLEVIEA
jgi:hypothetical protein